MSAVAQVQDGHVHGTRVGQPRSTRVYESSQYLPGALPRHFDSETTFSVHGASVYLLAARVIYRHFRFRVYPLSRHHGFLCALGILYLWMMQQAVTGKKRDEITLEVQDMSWGTFKPLLAEATVEYLVSRKIS